MIKYKGKTYTSIAKLCSTLNLPYSKFCRYYREEKSIEKAVERCVNSDKIQYAGKGYRSINALCKDLHLNKARFYYNFSKTNSIDYAVKMSSESDAKRTRIRIVLNNVTYTSIHTLCQDYDLNQSKFTKLYQANYSIEYILIHAKKREKIIYQGKVYNSIKSFCVEHKVDYQQFKKFYNRGSTVDEALEQSRNVLSRRSGELTYQGITYKNALDLCKKNNIAYNTFTKLLRQGKSVDEAAEMAKNKVIFTSDDGKEFYTYASLCEYFGINYTTFCHSGSKKNLTNDEIKEQIHKNLLHQRKKYFYNGNTYSSFYQFCQIHRINYAKALALMKDGLTGEEILDRLLSD